LPTAWRGRFLFIRHALFTRAPHYPALTGFIRQTGSLLPGILQQTGHLVSGGKLQKSACAPQKTESSRATEEVREGFFARSVAPAAGRQNRCSWGKLQKSARAAKTESSRATEEVREGFFARFAAPAVGRLLRCLSEKRRARTTVYSYSTRNSASLRFLLRS